MKRRQRNRKVQVDLASVQPASRELLDQFFNTKCKWCGTELTIQYEGKNQFKAVCPKPGCGYWYEMGFGVPE